MTSDVRQFLSAFDALTPTDQQHAAAELLRRMATQNLSPLSDDALTQVADAAFLDLDAREADHVDR